MAVANMEHLYVKDKIKCGRQLLDELKPAAVTPQHFWALGRLGARVLLYGSIDRVIPPEEVAEWISILLDKKWRDPKPVAAALAQLARKTGDYSRDMAPEVIHAITNWMKWESQVAPQIETHLKYLREVVPMEKQEEGTIFGESLPAGIVLRISDFTKKGETPLSAILRKSAE